jgi:hypothetical protein
MIRMILGIVIGIGVAIVTVMIMQKVGHIMYPPPPDFEVENSEALRAYVDTMPLGAFLFVLASYFIGTFDGVFIACLIARLKYHIFAILIGGLMLILTIVNLIVIPHPHWFSASAVVGIIASAFLAYWLATRTLPEGPHP